MKHGYAARDGDPYTPVPKAVSLKDNLFELRPPAEIPLDLVKRRIAGDKVYDQLYPAIKAALLMIQDECPQPVDLNAKPWCEHQAIMALGDGDIGVVLYEENYLDATKPREVLPENLFQELTDAKVPVHTFSIGRWRTAQLYPCYVAHPDQYRVINVHLTCRFGANGPSFGITGEGVMRVIAKRTGGTDYVHQN